MDPKVTEKNLTSNCDPKALYIHIPFCTAKCPYCGFYSEPVANHDAGALVSALITQMRLYDLAGIETVYIGGGSPTSLPLDQLRRLTQEITGSCTQIKEFTVEVNPSQANAEMLDILRRAGVNRLSIGAQSFNQNELDFLGRTGSVDSIALAVQLAGNFGFDNINLDLIFAIPGSTLESFEHTLRRAIDLNPAHISAYALTYEPGTLLYLLLRSGKIYPVTEETDREMYELAIDLLTDAGLQQYEISNFARQSFACRHNLIYWANDPCIGIGPAATSHLNRTRYTNIADIKKFTQAVSAGRDPAVETETLTGLEFACETAVLNLRRTSGIDLAQFELQTGFDAAELFAEAIESNSRDGMLDISAGRLFLTPPALPIADSILCDFAVI